MDLAKVNEFPYILDEWEKLVKSEPDARFVFDGISDQGLTRAAVDDQASRVYAYLKSKEIKKCEFDHNTLADNSCQIGVQRSRDNRIYANLILGGETGVEFSEDCDEEDMINDISGNAGAGLEDEESWSPEYGKVYAERTEIADGFRSLIDDVGSRFLPDSSIMEIYEEMYD